MALTWLQTQLSKLTSQFSWRQSWQQSWRPWTIALSLAILCFLGLPLLGINTIPGPAPSPTYQTRTVHDPDGIGKFYWGREIAQVMGHRAALWLERPSREIQEGPQQLLTALDLHPTDVVADIGAGTGYLSFRIAPLVPAGKVIAVDIQPEMLNLLNILGAENEITNVETVLGTEMTPNLPPNTVDLALMVDAYHEFAYPREMMQGIMTALKPGGRVVLAEYRKENPLILIKPLHKMTAGQVKQEMRAIGFQWLKTDESLPQQHLLFFEKPVF
jgi:SAM-dependent methyltransferase